MFDFSVLREIRTRAGLTLNALSEASGVSIAVISKLERNQNQAEVGTLYKLGRVLGMRATDILTLAEAPLANRREEENYKSGGFTVRAVRFRDAECLYVEGAKGAVVSKPDIHQDDNEMCWVLDGHVRIKLPNETHDLVAGSSLQFDAIQEHTYEALADSKFIVAHLRKAKRY